jgi:uncharacterized protein YdeI (YjbR/CyaY-like superfamily)
MATTKKRRLKRARHSMPAFVRNALNEHGLMDAYKARPAYQKNDYLGWIKSAKQDVTRRKRLSQMLSELKRGKKYMNMAWSGGPSSP